MHFVFQSSIIWAIYAYYGQILFHTILPVHIFVVVVPEHEIDPFFYFSATQSLYATQAHLNSHLFLFVS